MKTIEERIAKLDDKINKTGKKIGNWQTKIDLLRIEFSELTKKKDILQSTQTENLNVQKTETI